MAKAKKTAGQFKNKISNEDLVAIQTGETLREVADRLGLSSKEAWKAKQAREKEQRTLRISEKKKQMLVEAVEKKHPTSPKKATIKKKGKGVQVFPLQKLPIEARKLIFKHGLVKRQNKKPALLTALRVVPELYKEAMNSYYQVNTFTLGLIVDSPLPNDVEDKEAVQVMRHIKVHVPHVSPMTRFTRLFFTANSVTHLTLTTASSTSMNVVLLHYLPRCTTLISLSIVAAKDWAEIRFFGYPHPYAEIHPVTLLNKLLGEKCASGRWLDMGKGTILYHWVSNTRAGADGRGPRLPFKMGTPTNYPYEWGLKG